MQDAEALLHNLTSYPHSALVQFAADVPLYGTTILEASPVKAVSARVSVCNPNIVVCLDIVYLFWIFCKDPNSKFATNLTFTI